jgi:branched-chain amino acid transport system permease protein
LLFLQFCINGILVGGVYALLALGIVLIYKSTRVFNFAVGEMLTLGGFVLYFFMTIFKCPVWIGLPLAFFAALLIGLGIERLTLRPLIGQPILAAIMATLALSLILRGIIFITFGSPTVPFPSKILPQKTVLFGELFFPLDLVFTFLIAMLVFILLSLFFKFTKTGMFMRATAESHETAQATGIQVERIFGITWGIASLTATIGGILLADRIGLGLSSLPGLALKAFPAVLFGGLESIGGAILGGIIIGILESLVGGYVDPKFSEITPYVVLLIILLFRPEGLFGLKRIERI